MATRGLTVSEAPRQRLGLPADCWGARRGEHHRILLLHWNLHALLGTIWPLASPPGVLQGRGSAPAPKAGMEERQARPPRPADTTERRAVGGSVVSRRMCTCPAFQRWRRGPLRVLSPAVVCLKHGQAHETEAFWAQRCLRWHVPCCAACCGC